MSQLLAIVVSNAAMATILAAIVFVLTRFIKSAPIVHGLWILVLLKLITPPLVDLPESFVSGPKSTLDRVFGWNKEPVETIGYRYALSPDDIARFGELDQSKAGEQGRFPMFESALQFLRDYFVMLLLIVWGLGSAVIAITAIVRTVRFRRVLERSPLAARTSQLELERLSNELGVQGRPEARLTIALLPPMIWCWRNPPTILVPTELLRELSPRQRKTLFAHELAHLSRGDHWVRLFEMIVVTLFWWHPIVWLARRELLNAQEQCCDAWVLRALPDHPDDYAETLMRTIDFLSGTRVVMPPAATGFGYFNLLKRRFTMILSNKLSPRMSWASRAAILALGGFVLSVGQVPSFADEGKTKAEKIELIIEALTSNSEKGETDLDEKSMLLLLQALQKVKAKEAAKTATQKAPKATATFKAVAKPGHDQQDVYVIEIDPKSMAQEGQKGEWKIVGTEGTVLLDKVEKLDLQNSVEGVKIIGEASSADVKPHVIELRASAVHDKQPIKVEGHRIEVVAPKNVKGHKINVEAHADAIEVEGVKLPAKAKAVEGQIIHVKPNVKLEGKNLDGSVDLILKLEDGVAPGEKKEIRKEYIFKGHQAEGKSFNKFKAVKGKPHVIGVGPDGKAVEFHVDLVKEGVATAKAQPAIEFKPTDKALKPFIFRQGDVKFDVKVDSDKKTPQVFTAKVVGKADAKPAAKKVEWSVKQSGTKLIITSPDGRVGEVHIEDFKQNSEKVK